MKIDSTIFATVLTLFVSFCAVPIYKTYVKYRYVRRFLKSYIDDYVDPLNRKILNELSSNDIDNFYIFSDEISHQIYKMIRELSYSKKNELNYLSSDYSFELIRINSYTLAILGDVIKLLNNYYLFNDLS